ncbi:MAG TPA: Rne/Rng family ribonuclease [Candidatus Baltobacteraceae bacterium]|nr:Rne/Rng family ribonuclease [Candidatus Baltobacteraceae bacterium]
MSTEILISSDPWENRVAILENSTLSEIYIEREEKVIGSIFKGKVQNVLPGMGASFVDIGLGRNAFLYVDDINKTPLNIGDVEITQGRSGWTITDKVNRGDDVLVQIVKEPRGLKGARISTNISLPGRYLILMPTGKYSGVSRKIDSADERNRLKGIMKRIRPEGMATVVRTAAANASEAELIADLGVLIRMWHGILESYKRAPSPSLLHKDMNLVYKAARDFITADVDKVYIDNEEEYRKVCSFLQLLGPQYLDRVTYYNSGRSLFKDYKIDEELQKLMKPKINLPSGGSIVIETTEALTVIDVNSGKFTGGKNLEDTIVKTNIEAAAEIARQVRLRDIGGIVVCDFIDMNSESSRNKVVQTLENGLRKDRTRATIQSFSNLGLLEFTRKRVGKDLGSQLRGSCPTCSGLGSVMSSQSVAIETLRRVRAHAANGHADHDYLLLETAPTVAAQLEFWYEEETEELSKELGKAIHVRVDPLLHPEKVRLRDVAEIGKDGALRVGDEHEVELLAGRLPNVTSAAAVIDGRIIEVENAANMAGQTARIKLIDVDVDSALAELAAAAPGERKRKRRRGGRKAPLTASEQTEQLRELAEEAAKFSSARPPIGITTVTEDEERADKAVAGEERGERAPEAIVIGDERHEAGEGEGRKRRRRRRRRGGRGRGEDFAAAQAAGIPAQSAQAQSEPLEDEDEDEAEIDADAGEAVTPAGTEGEGEVRRRRRRRRRRGGRGHRHDHEQPQGEARPPSMPDRHIFRVGADGSAEPTGETAPREPGRAIAPWNRKAAPPAVEPPPPSLRAPEEGVKPTKPARRRRTAAAEAPPVRGGELAGAPTPALPAPEETPKAKRTTTRKSKSAAADGVLSTSEAVSKGPSTPEAVSKGAKPKRTATRKKAEPKAAPAAETPSAPEPKAKRTRTAAVKKTSSTRKTAAKTPTRKKKS